MSDIQGQIVRVRSIRIVGWAFSKKDKEPLSLDLYINDDFRGTLISNELRKGFLLNKKHPTGNVGFNFNLRESPLQNGDIIKIFHNDKLLNIQNCPYDFRTADQKILIVGLPKSGTSICTYRIKDALPDYCKLHFEPEGRKGLNKFMTHYEITMDPCVVTKNLFTIGEKDVKLDLIQKLYNKKIWIYRDPRDLLISSFFYKWNFSHKPSKEEFQKSLKAVKLKEKDPQSIPFNKLVFSGRPEKAVERKYKAIFSQMKTLDKSWHLLKYEDLVDGNVEELETYLGFKINKDSAVAPHLKRVERSKNYGSWRHWFTKEDVDIFKPIFDPIMSELEYNTDDWEIINPETLPAQEGSEYMSKLFNGGFRPQNNIFSKFFNFK